MPDTPALNIVLIVVCVFLSGFFSSSEAAFLSLQRARLAHLVETRKSGALRVSKMIEEPERPALHNSAWQQPRERGIRVAGHCHNGLHLW